MEQIKKKKISRTHIMTGFAIILQALILVYVQFHFSFMMEDLDYLKNLRTGGTINSLADIFSGMSLILKTRGGSALSAFVLQCILLAGENFANILNVLVIFLIVFLISRLIGAGKKDIFFYALPFFLLFSLNDDWQYCYTWQFGITNFVYPSIPLLIYLILLTGELEINNNAKSIPEKAAGVICAFLCSWANAAYGAVLLFGAALSVILIKKMIGKKIPLWIWISGGAALAGIGLYASASGNYAEGSVIRQSYISFGVFSGVILALMLLAVSLRCGGWLSIKQLLLIAVLGFAVIVRFAAALIRPMEDNGIQVCTLILSITLFCSMVNTLRREHPDHGRWSSFIMWCAFGCSFLVILANLGGVS